MVMLLPNRRALLGSPASPFSPLDIAGLQLWLKADAGLYQDAAMATPAVADADPVGGWADQSGNSNHATQATAGSRPLLKLAIQNGRSVVRFDGTDDKLISALALVQPLSVFVVNMVANFSTYRAVLGGQSTDILLVSTKITEGFIYIYAGAALEGGYLVAGAMHLRTAIFNGASSLLALNGGTPNLGSVGSNNTTLATIGANVTNSFLAGDIAEILIYNSALSTANRQAVEAYLNSRWAVY